MGVLTPPEAEGAQYHEDACLCPPPGNANLTNLLGSEILTRVEAQTKQFKRSEGWLHSQSYSFEHVTEMYTIKMHITVVN